MRTTATPAVRLALAVALIVWTVIALIPRHRPAALPNTATAQDFSAERAMLHIAAIAPAPHPSGSPENAAARDYIRAEIAKLGVQSEVQSGIGAASPRWMRDGKTVSGPAENIVARLPGTANTRPVLLMAHYDSTLKAPGAADNASGVAVLLETMRALRAAPPLRNDVIFLFPDAEERGLLGAALFHRDHRWGREPGIVLNFEAAGPTGPSLMYQTSAGNQWMIQQLSYTRPPAESSSLLVELARIFPDGDNDLSPFRNGGLSGMAFAFVQRPAGWRRHSPADTIDRVDHTSLQQHGNNALILARRFGELDLVQARTGDAVWFYTSLSGLLLYSASWKWPLAALTLIILALATWAARRRRARGLWIAVPLAVVAILELLVAARVPGASHVFTWPLLAGLISFAVLVTSPEKLGFTWRVVALFLCAAPVLLILVPLMPMSYNAYGDVRRFQMYGPVISIAALLIVVTLLPQFVVLVRRTRTEARQTISAAASAGAGASTSSVGVCSWSIR